MKKRVATKVLDDGFPRSSYRVSTLREAGRVHARLYRKQIRQMVQSVRARIYRPFYDTLIYRDPDRQGIGRL